MEPNSVYPEDIKEHAKKCLDVLAKLKEEAALKSSSSMNPDGVHSPEVMLEVFSSGLEALESVYDIIC